MPDDDSVVGGSPPTRLEIRLLGSVEVVLDGQRLRVFESPRLQRFLGLLTLGGDAQTRSKLAFELWPDSSESQARTNLRKLLHELRHALADIDLFMEITNETVRWIQSELSAVDVLRLKDALAIGDLELAAQLYSGDFLPSCYDDWVLQERAYLESGACGAMERLMQESMGRGDHEISIRYANRILGLEPTHEPAAKCQMEALLAIGDKIGALRSYHRFVEVLGRELGVSPGAEIQAVYTRIKSELPKLHPVKGPGPSLISESTFVGRDSEWSQLIAAWNNVKECGAHLALISGEPGIGKSRLALELGRHVRDAGHPMASARAYEAAGRLPWGPVIDLLRSEILWRNVESLDPVWKNELNLLMPELSDHSTSPGVDQSGDPLQRHRLFDAVHRAITAENRPILLVIDDLQWCDAETIELIGYIIHLGKSDPVLIVGTVRSEEVPEDHPLVALLDGLGRDRAVTTVPLEPLDEAATATLAAQLVDEEPTDSKMASLLWKETEGNPLFIIESIRAGYTSKECKQLITPTMRTVLGARLGQLSDGARRVAEAAAVIGRSFSVDLLAEVTGMGENKIVDCVDELWRRRIIRDQRLTYDFSHDKLRAVALEMVSPARRRQLHLAIAKAMVAEDNEKAIAASPQLAAHYDQAGLVAPAVEAYRKAGTRATSVSALDEAVRSFRRALAMLADLPPSADRDALELDIRIALGSPLVALEGYGSSDAHQLYERAISLCRKLNKPVHPPILRGLGLARLQGCRFDQSSELGEALLNHESRDPVARTEGMYLLGVSAFWRGDLDASRNNLKNALESYDITQRDMHLALYAQDPKAVCLVRLALTELWLGDPGRADDSARSAMQIAKDLDHAMTRWYVVTYASILAAESEDFDRLTELLEEADALWKRFPMPYLMIVGEGLRGWLEVQQGSPGGLDKIVRAVERSRVPGETLHLTYTLLLLARARGIVGDYRQGRIAAQEGLALSDKFDQHYLESELWRADGKLAYHLGEKEAASESLMKAIDTANRHGAGWLELRALSSLVSRFPDPEVLSRLKNHFKSISSGHQLPAFREAKRILEDSG